jgi:hypothetical protein
MMNDELNAERSEVPIPQSIQSNQSAADCPLLIVD